MNLVDLGRGPWQSLTEAASRVVQYIPYQDMPAPFEIKAFVRGQRAEDMWAAAMQADIVAVLNADALALALPGRPRPMRYDRINGAGMAGMRYSVEEWRGAPHYENPVLFKLLLRGGNQ